MKASDLFVKALENEGIRYIFGVPGEETLDLLESIRKSRIRFILTRHEQSAAFMAATVGRLTGKAGVCLSTLGPGATNLVTGAAYAQLGGMPLFMITGQKGIRKRKQGHFQVVNTVEIMRPITKFTQQITEGANIPALVREAFRRAEEERPGATHLELPEDIAHEEVDAPLFPVNRVRRPIAEYKAVSEAVTLMMAAKHPLILVGAGANRKLVSKMLREFIDKTRIPFFNTQMGKGVIDERHPLYLGTAALSGNDYLHCAIDRADLIVNIGHDVIEKPPFIMQHGGAKVIHINFFPTTIDEVYFPELEVVGDIANTLWQMKEKLSPQPHWDFSYFFKVKGEIQKRILEEQSMKSEFSLSPPKIIQIVRKIFPEDGIVTLDNGMYKIWFAREYTAYAPNTLLLDNALATMGAGLPSAMAAKLLYPSRKVVAVCGDGGFMMNSQELETAMRLELDLVILLLNDNGYGMIQWKQNALGFSDFGLSYSNPDFIRYAESFGAKGYHIEREEELSSFFEKSLKENGIHLLEIPIDYSLNQIIFTQELSKKNCLL